MPRHRRNGHHSYMNSISSLSVLLISSLSLSSHYANAAPSGSSSGSHTRHAPSPSPSLHEVIVGASSRENSGHIQIARNHGLQSRRQRDPHALLAWADEQAARLVNKHARGKRKRRKEEITGKEDSLSKRQDQGQGYAELHNLFSDTEVSVIPKFTHEKKALLMWIGAFKQYYATISIGTPPRKYQPWGTAST